MEFFQTNQKKKTMIILDTPLLRMAGVEEEALVVSEVLVALIFQTFLRTSLVILVEVGEVLIDEILTIVVLI